MALYKNIASQKVLVFAWDSGNSVPKTGDSGNITAYISLDGGAGTVTDDATPTEVDAGDLPGIYVFDLLQGETDGDIFCLVADSSTEDIIIAPVVAYTVVKADYKADVSALATEAGGNVAAIRERTDNLPDDPADDSDIDGQLSTIQADLDNPSQYKANVAGLAPANEYDAELTAIQADLDNPNQYKADVSSLATILTHLTQIKGAGWTDENLKAMDALIDAIKAKTDTIVWADITFLKDMEGGKWKIVGNQMIFYKSDNSTVVATFNLFDSDGNAAMVNVFERQRA